MRLNHEPEFENQENKFKQVHLSRKYTSNADMIRQVIHEFMSDKKARDVGEIIDHVMDITKGQNIDGELLTRNAIDFALYDLVHSASGYVKDKRGVYRYTGNVQGLPVQSKEQLATRVADILDTAHQSINNAFMINIINSPIPAEEVVECGKIGEKIINSIDEVRNLASYLFLQTDKCKRYSQDISEITENADDGDIYTSPEFHCKQTEYFPVSLCANWKKGKAWLQLSEASGNDLDAEAIRFYFQCCVDFGIRDCPDEEAYNSLLQELGEEAVESAEIESENEGMVMT